MTKPTPAPSICDGCSKPITEETQYVMEVYQGKRTFGDEIIKASSNIDFCHPCFIKVCKNGYLPKWKKMSKNPQYVAGSKNPTEKYWITSSYEEIE